MTFGAYVHTKPDNSIFYVGKGRIRRAKNLKRNIYHSRIVEKYGAENIGVGFIECSSEDIAFELEKGLIKCLRRSGVKLTNMTDGGEGVSGYTPSPELIARRSQSLRGRKCTEETKAKIAAANKGKIISQERREHHSKVMTGRKASQETRDKMSAARIGKKMPPKTPEQIANMSAAHIGKSNGKRTPEQRAKMAAAMLGVKRKKPFSEESRANMSEAQRIRRANEKLNQLLGVNNGT